MTTTTRRPPRRWLAIAALVAGLGLFAVVVATFSRGPRIPARTVTDASYTRAADAACRQALPPLQAERPQQGERPKDKAELVAEKVERTADGLEKLVSRLRAQPVAASDRARVDRWLDDWDSYIAVGRRYSRALRSGDGDAPTRAAEDGDRITRRIYLFSKANGMPSCVL